MVRVGISLDLLYKDESGHLLRACGGRICMRGDGPVGPLVHVVAKHAFSNLAAGDIQHPAEFLGYDLGDGDLFDNLFVLVQKILKVSDDEGIKILKRRTIKEKHALKALDAFDDIDDQLTLEEKKERKRLKEQGAAGESGRKAFKAKWHEKRTKVKKAKADVAAAAAKAVPKNKKRESQSGASPNSSGTRIHRGGPAARETAHT